MTVKLTQEGQYAFLTLDRPEVLNALSFDIIKQISQALDRAAQWDIRALIITGAGDKAFCAGADIKELMGRSLQAQKEGAELGQATFAKLDRFPVPSIAAINGYAFGGGLELALACTFRVASKGARFGLPEVKLGLIPGYGGTQRLPRLIGEAQAMELILTGRTVKPEQALQMGLVNQLVDDDVLAGAIALADQFSVYSKLAIGFAREAVQRAHSSHLSDGLRLEADLSTLAYRTEDADEGMRAFVEKRNPQFKDR
ncbi:enoyl-CoA hydratase/isomerase family protein [Pseudomonas synxantha]|uniref:Enoyl-CoA hydratase/isomerase family protein n=1 Tax=Pseudomonas synxantha TaxID=47883 RepID=A0ABS0UR80_9PSED|nr:enoyl-CoA hydratase-related protein [Pseudomonas synxantha]MBI6567085.1 enoyl-CoA hydratase/isomerase family protein [Pseudomonas synxantha]MBI6583406.1 enoyl-CoA hydratase/isomerase family protein [Pseudomonas synxantha]MBI6643404.1 enoyl-CoA hydratase/isomerase family protein [Pseudomonas synxantha]